MAPVIKPLLQMDAMPLIVRIVPLKCVQHLQLHARTQVLLLAVALVLTLPAAPEAGVTS